VGAEAFWLTHDPARLRSLPADLAVPPGLDAEYRGGTLYLEHPWSGVASRRRLRAGVSAGEVELGGDEGGTRLLAFAEHATGLTWTRGRQGIGAALALHGSAGRTGGDGWRRGLATGAVGVTMMGLNAQGQVTYGRVNDGAPEWERFAAGGIQQQLFDDAVLSQRLEMPAARFGVARGREVLLYRASTNLRGLTAYYWGARGDDHDWYRVAGVETTATTPALNLIRLPALRLTAGVGYPLDEPDRHELNVYTSLGFRP
jgi:hypothetical protein